MNVITPESLSPRRFFYYYYYFLRLADKYFRVTHTHAFSTLFFCFFYYRHAETRLPAFCFVLMSFVLIVRPVSRITIIYYIGIIHVIILSYTRILSRGIIILSQGTIILSLYAIFQKCKSKDLT